MRRASPFLPLTACALIAASTACRGREPGTETASRGSSDSANEAAPTERGGQVALTAASDEARTLYLRGRELSEQLRTHDARKLFEQAAAKDPKFALAHYSLALSSPTPKEFLAHLNQAVTLSSKASEGERLMILALQAGANGDSKKSLEYSQELVARYPRDARAQTQLGNAYANQQEFDKAASQLTKATALDPSYTLAYNSLGYAYMPQGKYSEAETAFKKYIELVPNDPNPYDSYAEMLMRTGRFDESIVQYQKALSVDPHFSNSYIGIASNLMFQGKHDAAAAQAQKLYDAALDDGDRRTAMLGRAVIYVDQSQTAQAMREMEKLYSLDARLGDTAAMSADAGQMGDILLGGGRADEALKRYQQSLTLVQGSGLSTELKDNAKLADHYNLARVALAKRDTATAAKEAQQYISGAEATHDVGRIRQGHELAGTIALQERDFDKAVDELGQADQQDPYILYTLATAYQGKGDAAKAKELAGRAADMHILPTIRYALVRTKAMKMM
jgi:tetratricopeptide (TPR) repeat protein